MIYNIELANSATLKGHILSSFKLLLRYDIKIKLNVAYGKNIIMEYATQLLSNKNTRK